MKSTKRTLLFEKSGYYFIALFALAIAGFWPSYFSTFFDGSADFNFYFHFHAVLAVLWIFMLIAQPLLIRRKQFALHRTIGKLSYVLVPLIFISIILLAHNRITGEEENLGLSLWIPFKDLLIFAVGYGIAIKYRHRMPIHARGMIVAGIVLIEPALVRLILYVFFPDAGFAPGGYMATLVILYALLIGLIIAERNQKQGRWVFPLALGLYLFVHSVIIFEISIGPWQAFSEWFAALPLT
ncbi:hypothetical protein [Ulvibacterium marinum]|uniref:Uncharacterized protein n=1 Tax=Ulvibacterium marinum TaxID=2419782 RepID=A0A3B0CF39_9FLAO|nr:hypothetical protein [Ulvibacterium marinum]RKN81686.1 hypothetical protein D7Z94_12355 [Ulvibacterium marinum]